jgi:hypothetical protein
MLKRILFFVYGVAAYLMFLGSYLYAIGFIGNFAVPTRLDGPRAGPLGVALAVNAGLLGAVRRPAQRDGRPWFKDWWTRLRPEASSARPTCSFRAWP